MRKSKPMFLTFSFSTLPAMLFLTKTMEVPTDAIGKYTSENLSPLFQQWLSESFEAKRAESTGASLSANGEIPAIEGIVILPAFEEGESPWPAFEFVSQNERSKLQSKIAEKLRKRLFELKPATKARIATPTREEWRNARDSNADTWEALLSPFAANAVLSLHGKYNETLMTYGVKLELNQMGTIYPQGLHRFAFTEAFFRENFDEVILQVLAAPILRGPETPDGTESD